MLTPTLGNAPANGNGRKNAKPNVAEIQSQAIWRLFILGLVEEWKLVVPVSDLKCTRYNRFSAVCADNVNKQILSVKNGERFDSNSLIPNNNLFLS
jgi:hypothetical protein